ncbi:MAG: nucleotide pyrophosphohydrolase [Burkholderiaceae bacterium]
MPSRLVDVAALGHALEEFAAERQWARYHSPKNLAMAVANETGELVELFQWLTEAESYALAREPGTARAVRDELADVLIYLVRLAWQLDVDLDEAVRDKLVQNARKYPPPAEQPACGGSPE